MTNGLTCICCLSYLSIIIRHSNKTIMNRKMKTKSNFHVMEAGFIRKGFTWMSKEEAIKEMNRFKDFFPDVEWDVIELDSLAGWPLI